MPIYQIQLKQQAMKNIHKMHKLFFILCLGICLTNCEGEDGLPGPDGQDGIDGIDGIDGVDGTNGTDGTNGQNGVGFDELLTFGNISITYTGIRPDNAADFTDTTDFKFTGIDARALEEFNSFTKNIDEPSITFSISRFLNTPNNTFQDSAVTLQLTVSNLGEQNEAFEFSLDFEEYNIIFEDRKVLQVEDNHENDQIINLQIINFNFNDDTNQLTFSFSFDVAGENNVTGNDINISGEADVVVLENIGTEVL